MKINTNLIKFDDICYIPENDITQPYGYAVVKHVEGDFIHLELDDGQYLSVSAQDLSDMKVDFVHKEEWIRDKRAYFKG